MAMGTSPAPEHDAPVEDQLRAQWPGIRLETPESPVPEGREAELPRIETR